MQQVMWETVFNKQFEEFLEKYGIDISDHIRMNSLKQHLNITRKSSCKLMVEVEENWQEKLTQLLKEDNFVRK